MRVILGSASPRRTEILRQAGIEHEVVASGCEEKVTKTIPSEVVSELSEIKAEDVWHKVTGQVHGITSSHAPAENNCEPDKRDGNNKDLIVITADTIVAVDDTIYGKPSDRKDAHSARYIPSFRSSGKMLGRLCS